MTWILRLGERVQFEPEEYEGRVLAALVHGFRAREGMKERFRALNEYEIARRLGVTSYSYVEYESCSERGPVRRALEALALRGLVRFGSPSGRYDSYIPISLEGQGERPPTEPTGAAPGGPDPTSRLERQLQEIIELLRSIDRKLGSSGE